LGEPKEILDVRVFKQQQQQQHHHHHHHHHHQYITLRSPEIQILDLVALPQMRE
jgi:G3E family GTPase